MIENLTEEKSRKMGISRRNDFYIKQKLKNPSIIKINKYTIQKIQNSVLDHTN